VEDLGGEIVVVDSGSTDRTREIAASFGARVYAEEWKGFAAQKNSAIEKAQSEWVLLLDADEEVSAELLAELRSGIRPHPHPGEVAAWLIPRQNLFLGRWIKYGGFWPDRKLRLFRQGSGRVEDRAVHETIKLQGCGNIGRLRGALIHHAYPTLDSYLEHMRRYAALGAEMIADKPRVWLWLNRWLNPPLTFFYNYFVRLGFLDGREGRLLHWHHSRYVAWKYGNALELQGKGQS